MAKFKKGQSGNPKGRPKGRSLGDELRKLLEEDSPVAGKTWKRALAEKMIFVAMKTGDARMCALIFERAEGKVSQPISGDPDDPITFRLKFKT